MKKVILFAAVVAMSLAVAMPLQAQNRKDKKAAAKAQWEMEQQQQREEAALRHKMRMDSIANAQKAADEKAQAEVAAQAKREREKQEIEDLQRQITLDSLKRVREAKQWDMEETTLNEPCSDIGAPEGFYRAHGVGEHLTQATSIKIAQENAWRDLASRFSSTIQTLMEMQLAADRSTGASIEGGLVEQFTDDNKIDDMTRRAVETSLTGAAPLCKETRTYMSPQLHRKVFKTYVTYEVSEEKCLKPLYETIQKEADNQLKMRYDNFKEEFKKHFGE